MTEGQDDLQFTNTPNLLTLGRIFAVPLVVAALFFDTHTSDLIAGVLFGLAAITDFFDGYIARAQKLVTVYGKLMDPLADKFLVVCCLIMLQYLNRINPVVVMLVICREVAITGLRALASAEGVIISASGSAKWKTALQMFAIAFIIVRSALFGFSLYNIGIALLYLSLALSLWSAKDYVVDFFKGLRESRRQKLSEKRAARQARLAARAARMAIKARRGQNSV